MEDNYSDILNKKYNAVCLGVDSIMTDSNKIDERILDEIVKLLKRKIPVIFVIDDEKGIHKLESAILHLDKSVFINEAEIEYIYLFFKGRGGLKNLLRCGYEFYWDICVYKSEKIDKLEYALEEFNQRHGWKCDIRRYYEELDVCFSLRYDNTNIPIESMIYDELSKEIEAGSFGEKVRLYKDKCNDIFADYKLNVAAAVDDIELDEIKGATGVPPKNVLRIIKKSLTWTTDDTYFLLTNSLIAPPICMDDVNKNNYSLNFAMFERDFIEQQSSDKDVVSENINKIFSTREGIDYVFDRYIGGVTVKMYDWLLSEIENENFLHQFWSKRNDGIYKNVILDDNNFILRGANTYYYFLNDCKFINGTSVITKEDVLTWYINYSEFFEDASLAIKKYLQYELGKKTKQRKIGSLEKLYLLGILDNCRNVLLVLLNNSVRLRSNSLNSLIPVSEDEMFVLLLSIESMIVKLCQYEIIYNSDFEFAQYYPEEQSICLNDIDSIINLTNSYLRINYIEEALRNRGENYNYAKDYRPHRELDNFGEIYSSIYNTYSNGKYEKYEYLCGMCYGGIELPILATALFSDTVSGVYLMKQDIHYMDKKKLDIDNFKTKEAGGFIYPKELEGKFIKLFDDNILTGKSLQLATNILAEYGINVGSIHVVRRPTTNRLDQMFFSNTTAVNYRLLGNFIEGLTYTPNYTRKDTPYIREDGTIDGYDSFGITDMGLKKIYECLVKNHSYAEGSAVENYQKRLYKLPIK